METKHTPTPWGVAQSFPDTIVPGSDVRKPSGAASDPRRDMEYMRKIAHVCAPKTYPGFEHRMSMEEGHANAEFIVRAVNSHDKLIAACKSVLTQYETLRHGTVELIHDALYSAGEQKP